MSWNLLDAASNILPQGHSSTFLAAIAADVITYDVAERKSLPNQKYYGKVGF